MVTGIHHINFLVRELGEAVTRHRQMLGVEPIFEDLPSRGVLTARFKVGETWVVLVQPTGAGGVPAEYLERHGEGCFLISYRATNLESCLDELEARGVSRPDNPIRHGIADWRIVDVSEQGGVISQLAEGD